MNSRCAPGAASAQRRHIGEAVDGGGKRVALPEVADQSVAPLTRLRDHLEFLAADIEKYDYQRGCVFGNFSNEAADHSPAIREGLVASFGRWSEAVTNTVREAQVDGSVTAKQDPKVLSRFLVNAWEGAIVGERAAKDGSSFAAFFTVVFDAVLR